MFWSMASGSLPELKWEKVGFLWVYKRISLPDWLLEFNKDDLLGGFFIEVAHFLYKNEGGVSCEMFDEVSMGQIAPKSSARRQRSYGCLGKVSRTRSVSQGTSLLLRPY